MYEQEGREGVRGGGQGIGMYEQESREGGRG